MKVYRHLTELIGHTPLLELGAYSRTEGLSVPLWAKLEFLNPGGSVKDRPAYAMLCDAEERGLLRAGGTVIEPTSGNMGVGLAWIAVSQGYRMVVVMPETMSAERRSLVRALGAELHLSPGSEGMKGAVALAERLRDEIPGSIILKQFENDANPQSHVHTTAEEIWADTDGQIDVFVAGVGTGGTISGVGEGLKRHNPSVRIIAVEPASSPLLTEGRAAGHKIQGIGANFVPQNYHAEWVDQVVTVTDDDAIRTTRLLARSEGLLVGISSGAAVSAAARLARLPQYAGKRIVVLLPDTGERYLSTVAFDVEGYPLP